MSACDVFCQPNTAPEPFGIVFIEALYAGLPVVTSNMGGGAEIVTESCGRLISPNDAKALAEALAELMENSDNRSARNRNAPLRADELCNPARQMFQLEKVLRSMSIPGKFV